MSSLSKFLRGPFALIVAGLVIVLLVVQVTRWSTGPKDVPTSEAITLLSGSEKLTDVALIDGEQSIVITKTDGTKIRSYWVGNQSDQIVDLLNKRVAAGTLETWEGDNPQPGLFSQLIYTLGPILLLVLLFFFLMNMVQGGAGGGRGVMGFGKSRAKVATKDSPKTTFADVAGCDEAIEELDEIREFLAEPAKFQRVGAKIPKGVLLYGPPGTGKTLLARAVAGEAGVPFFSISGSDFVEMFVGVGASRVRDLFDQAKESAPAIIFIDEIDAVGRHRGAGMGGGHDEREQTLNQLLVEMDGFDIRGGVILIAATNRPDVLDPALLRPGRFDRQVAVEAPDLSGRNQILQVHSRGKPMGNDVDLLAIARRTPGYTGADLANVLNEAALLTARQNLPVIGNAQLDEAIDRVFAGPQKRSRLMNERERLITAYHEGGHALVAAAMPGTDPVQKITILPRGRALGYAMVMPDDDKYSQTRGELLDQMAYMMGGRAAEELIFHDPSTGASNDIEKATRVARAMVTQYGLSPKIGTVQLGGGDSEPFLGMSAGSARQIEYSDETARLVDEEVRTLLENAHQEAFEVLEANRDVLDRLVMELFAKETLTRKDVDELFTDLKRWPSRGAYTGSDKRVPSTRPPVEPPEMKQRQEQAARELVAASVASQSGTQGGDGGWQPPNDWAPPTWNAQNGQNGSGATEQSWGVVPPNGSSGGYSPGGYSPGGHSPGGHSQGAPPQGPPAHQGPSAPQGQTGTGSQPGQASGWGVVNPGSPPPGPQNHHPAPPEQHWGVVPPQDGPDRDRPQQ